MTKGKHQFEMLWLVFANIKAEEGKNINDLVDTKKAKKIRKKAGGAWANILIKTKSIQEVLRIAPLGLKELNFEIIEIDKIENFRSVVESSEVNPDLLREAKWLLDSDYVFKICGDLYLYAE